MKVYILFFIVAFVIVYIILGYNKLIRLRNNAKEAFSTVDIYLKKRFDLIPNIVETVKGYAKHESDVLERVVSARNKIGQSDNIQDKMKGENELSLSLGRLIALAEGYPELKANENFLSLQKELSKTEIEIANSRKYYNGTVKLFNTAIELFPSNIIAKIFKFNAMSLFEVELDKERDNIKVEF